MTAGHAAKTKRQRYRCKPVVSHACCQIRNSIRPVTLADNGGSGKALVGILHEDAPSKAGCPEGNFARRAAIIGSVFGHDYTTGKAAESNLSRLTPPVIRMDLRQGRWQGCGKLRLRLL
jgi:hypothetical protein